MIFSNKDKLKGWKVGHQSRDSLFYEEYVNGKWERINIDGEMQFGNGTPHHIIFFVSAEKWKELPAWTRDRRTEILERIKSECREPEYEYQSS